MPVGDRLGDGLRIEKRTPGADELRSVLRAERLRVTLLLRREEPRVDRRVDIPRRRPLRDCVPKLARSPLPSLKVAEAILAAEAAAEPTGGSSGSPPSLPHPSRSRAR
jgi:hypothetical protein